MKRMNKFSKKYYREIKMLFPSRGKYEQKLLRNYETRIIELNEEKPDITYQEICGHIGKPTDIINEYYSNVDTEYLITRLKTTRYIRRGIVTLVILALLSFAVTMGIKIKLYNDIHDIIPSKQEIIIE